MKKKVFNKGIMDMDLPNRARNPYYMRWVGMLTRCYSNEFHIKNPSYIGCEVSDEWLIFSNFYKWMRSQKWEGLQIDKDIIKPNNKVYCKENCCFVSKAINILFSKGGQKRNSSELPMGVYYYPEHTQTHRYMATISINNKATPLGSYETSDEAERAYLVGRIAYTKSKMIGENRVIKKGMERHIIELHEPRIRELNDKIEKYYKNPPPRESIKNKFADPRLFRLNIEVNSLKPAIRNFFKKRHSSPIARDKLQDKIPKLRKALEQRKQIKGET